MLLSIECVSSVLGYYESVWQAREAVQHNPMCMYGMLVSIGIISYRESLGTFWERLVASGCSVLNRLGTFECV